MFSIEKLMKINELRKFIFSRFFFKYSYINTPYKYMKIEIDEMKMSKAYNVYKMN